MPVIKWIQEHRAPRLRPRRGKGARKGNVRDQLPKALIPPPFVRKKKLPELIPCLDKACDLDPCMIHCRSNEDDPGVHAIDWRFAGWAKGWNDGTFDVACAHCGEVGWVHAKVRDKDVNWG